MKRFFLIGAILCGGLHASCDEFQDPQIEYDGFQISDEVEVTLFAREPMIANPIQMTFDPAGRLWVICSYVYPQILPGEAPHDKLIVLEDTDRDGQADKSTIFADGLNVPTGFELGDGGAYVANPPELLFFKDTNGDLVADERKVMLSGFGTEDNHHAINAWRWGPDGRIYYESGVFLHNQVETPYGVVRLENGGVWRWQPRTLRLEVYAHADDFANPWGLAFDRWGQNFLTEAPGGHIYYLAPATGGAHAPAPYPRIEGAPKSCGIEFVSGRQWPEEWQGDLILNAFKSKQVLRYKFSDDSSGFTAKEMAPLIVSTEPNFRPVDVKQGPDGAVYIADWFNPIIGHMQYNFRDPRRDKTHGRIWRMAYKGGPLLEPPRLVGLGAPELLDYLRWPEHNVRHQARRLLYELPAETVAQALAKWVENLDASEAEFEHHRLEALWVYQSIDVVNEALLRALLASPDPRVRAAAVRVLRDWHPHVREPLALLAALVEDAHPRVRLEAVAALGRFGGVQAMELAARALEHPMDRYLDYALRITANALRPDWLPALQAGTLTFDGDPERLAFVLRAVPSPEVVQPLLRMAVEGKIAAGGGNQVLDILVQYAGTGELQQLYASLLETSTQPAFETAYALDALRRAAGERDVLPESGRDGLLNFFADPRAEVRIAAFRLAGAWKLEAAREELTAAAQDPGATEETQRAAVEGLASLGGEESIAVLASLAARADNAEVRVAAAGALAGLDLTQGAAAAARLLAEHSGADLAPVLEPFLLRKGGSEAVAAALGGLEEPVAADTAKLALRYLQSAGREEPALSGYLNKAAGIDAEVAELTPEQMQAMVAQVQAEGDPHRGEEVFRGMDCFKCHAIAGGGGHLGPDLSGLGASAAVDYIIEAIRTPSKAIRENYEGLAITTKDWEYFTGVKLRETRQELVLRDSIHDEITIRKEDIEESKDIGSLMPVGLINTQTHAEFLDLVRFISELGKPGDFATQNAPVVRRWRMKVAVKDGAEPVWVPAYSLVSGDLPLKLGPDPVVLQFELEVTTPGEIAVRFDDAAGLALRVNEVPVALDAGTGRAIVHLDRGRARFLIEVDASRRIAKTLRAELLDLEGSAGRAQIISGI